MKDEAAGCPITEFVGLRSKMYSYTKDNGACDRTTKGVKKSITKMVIRQENYREVLFNSREPPAAQLQDQQGLSLLL